MKHKRNVTGTSLEEIRFYSMVKHVFPCAENRHYMTLDGKTEENYLFAIAITNNNSNT